MNPKIYRIWPGYIRSKQAYDSWHAFQVFDVPMVTTQEDTLRAREIANAASHAKCLRMFLDTQDTHCVVIEDDAILHDHHWMDYRIYDVFMPFVSNRSMEYGFVFHISEGVLPKYGTQAYIASRKFAENYIPLLESGQTSDHCNALAAYGLRAGCYNANAVIHDNQAPSTMCEERRLKFLEEMKSGVSRRLEVKRV